MFKAVNHTVWLTERKKKEREEERKREDEKESVPLKRSFDL
jgi:hypothetical protein